MIVEKINYIVGRVLIVLMMVMTLDVLWGVFTRYAMGNQANWSEELARFLLIWLGLLGATYASGKKMHLAIDLLSEKLEIKAQRILQQIIDGLIFLFAFCVMVIGGGRLLYIVAKLGEHSAALNIPMQLIYLVIPLSGILIMFYKFKSIVGNKV